MARKPVLKFRFCHKPDHVDFSPSSSSKNVQKALRFDGKISQDPWGTIIGLPGIFNILHNIIKSNQQSVQTLVCLAVLTFFFLLASLTSTGS